MTTNTNSSNIQLPKLNGKTYHHWSIQMKVLCEAQDLWDIVKHGIEKPDNFDDLSEGEEAKLKALKKKDRKALYLIYQAVDEMIFERISSSNSAPEAWNMLHKTYRGDDKVRIVKLQTLRCEFDALRMKDSETVEEFYNRAIILLSQLRINGETIEDNRIVEKILRSLTRKFEYIVVAIEESKDLTSLSLESLLGTLQSHKLRMRQFDNTPFEQAFQTQSSNSKDTEESSENKGKGKKPLSQIQYTSKRKEVRTGDDTSLSVAGIGEIMVDTPVGKKKIHDVYFVPGLRHNLLSVGQLLQKGYTIQFKRETCEIQDQSGNTLGKINMTMNRMFPLRFTEDALLNFKTSSNQNSILWHQRNDEVCESCILGKHARDSFPQDKAWRASSPLELVHTDICGPMKTHSLAGNMYVLSFIDDFSRKLWIYFLKEKSETCPTFKNFKVYIERQSGHQIKTLISDGGGEYTSNHFLDYLKENGIHYQMTTRYTPQQDGVAKRANRTIIEKARSMLRNKNLDNTYWGEAVACACYLINRTSTKSLDNKTLQEAWSGYKPTVKHLRVFGCIAYSHIPEQRMSKLDDKSEKCIFLGYSEKSKVYKLYNPVTKKTIVSRDVIFEEQKSWTKTVQAEAPNIIQMNNEEQKRIDVNDIADYALFADADPLSYQEASKEEKWKEAMDQEMNAITKNNTWDLVDLP
ncbi:hypothetical protein LXL04_011848 [Taraxacum kok-saghyz]